MVAGLARQISWMFHWYISIKWVPDTREDNQTRDISLKTAPTVLSLCQKNFLEQNSQGKYLLVQFNTHHWSQWLCHSALWTTTVLGVSRATISVRSLYRSLVEVVEDRVACAGSKRRFSTLWLRHNRFIYFPSWPEQPSRTRAGHSTRS